MSAASRDITVSPVHMLMTSFHIVQRFASILPFNTVISIDVNFLVVHGPSPTCTKHGHRTYLAQWDRADAVGGNQRRPVGGRRGRSPTPGVGAQHPPGTMGYALRKL